MREELLKALSKLERLMLLRARMLGPATEKWQPERNRPASARVVVDVGVLVKYLPYLVLGPSQVYILYNSSHVVSIELQQKWLSPCLVFPASSSRYSSQLPSSRATSPQCLIQQASSILNFPQLQSLPYRRRQQTVSWLSNWAMYMDFLPWLVSAFFTLQQKQKSCAIFCSPAPLPT